MRSFTRACCAVLLLAFGHVDESFAQAQASIARCQFTNGIAAREAIDNVTRIDVPPNNIIFFWTAYIIGKEGVEQLMKTGALSIRHIWRYGWDGLYTSDIIEVGIVPTNWIENKGNYLNEYNRNGFFQFRTFSFKSNIARSIYYVQSVDKNNNEILPTSRSNHFFRPSISINF